MRLPAPRTCLPAISHALPLSATWIDTCAIISPRAPRTPHYFLEADIEELIPSNSCATDYTEHRYPAFLTHSFPAAACSRLRATPGPAAYPHVQRLCNVLQPSS